MNKKVEYIYYSCLGFQKKYDSIWINDENLEIDIKDETQSMNLIKIWTKKGHDFLISFKETSKTWEIKYGNYLEYIYNGENLYEVVINVIYDIELREGKTVFEYELDFVDTYT